MTVTIAKAIAAANIGPAVPKERRHIKGAEKYRHVFKDGHTEEHIEEVLEPMELVTGLRLIVIYDYNDLWGTGGDSNIAVLKDGKLYECPDAIRDFLYDGEGEVEALKGPFTLNRGEYKDKRKLPEMIDGFEYTRVWKNEPDKELD